MSELQQRNECVDHVLSEPDPDEGDSEPSPVRNVERGQSPPPRRTRGRRRLLEEASTLLAGSLDYETTLAQVACLVVPTVADWCIIHLVERDGSIHWLATIHGDPAKAAVACELQRRYPRDPSATEGVAEVLRTGQPVLFGEITDAGRLARAQDGEHFRLLRALATRSAMIVPLVARERVVGALSFLSSRRRRRYGPADLDFAQELAQRAALAVDNAQRYRDAQAALHLREEIFATVVHDLRQPVSTVKAGAKLLLTSDIAEEPETVAWLAHRVDAAATRMSVMLGDLVDLARVESGRPLDLRISATDLVALVRDHVELYARTTDAHQFQVETDLPQLVGRWDSQRVERVISNLLSNAIKYSPNGGEIVVRLRSDTDDAGTWAVLEVQDHGVGIPAADLPHIFERYHRAANTVGRIRGSGIGLAGVNGVVEQHGGTVSAASEEGVGTTMTVRLPLTLT